MKTIILLSISILIAAPLSARAADAKTNWDNNCAQCHGKDGRADTKIGKTVSAKNLTDPKVQAAFTDAAATQTIKVGMKAMPAFGGKLSDDEIKALVAYVRSLKK